MTKREKSKFWSVRICNPSLEAACGIEGAQVRGALTYYVFGNAIGKNGKLYWEGFVVFKIRKYLSGVKKLFPTAALEIKSTRSTYSECIAFCKKKGTFDEWGIRPVDADRWMSAFDAAKNGEYEKIPADMLIKFYHTFKAINKDQPKRPKMTKRKVIRPVSNTRKRSSIVHFFCSNLEIEQKE